jgi:Na+/proline symporter
MSGGGMMGNIGLSAAMGICFILCANLGSGAGLGMGAIIVARPLRKSGSRTIAEFIQRRYDSPFVAYSVPLIVVIVYTVYLVAQMKASGTVGQYLLDVSFNTGLVITWVIFTLYVMVGGMLAVTWTDFFQGLLMMTVTIVAAVTCLVTFGGFENLLTEATALYPNMGTFHLPLLSYMGYFYLWVMVGMCSPHILMRVSTTKSPFGAAVSMHGGMLIITVFSFATSVILGAGSRVVVGAGNVDNFDGVFLQLVERMFGPIMQGLTSAAIYAAIMSTAAGLLLAAAASIANDIIPRLKKDLTEKQKTSLGSASVLFVSIIVLTLSFNPPQYLSILYSQGMAFMVSTLLVPLLAGLWWKRATALGAALAIIGGGTTFIIVFFVIHVPLLSEVFFAVPVALVCQVIGSLMTSAPSKETLKLVENWHTD